MARRSRDADDDLAKMRARFHVPQGRRHLVETEHAVITGLSLLAAMAAFIASNICVEPT